MAPYPSVTDQNVTGMLQLFTYANNITNNWLGAGILLAVWVISFVAMKQFRVERAMAASTFMVSIIGILLRMLGFVTDKIVILSVLALAVSVFWLFKRE